MAHWAVCQVRRRVTGSGSLKLLIPNSDFSLDFGPFILKMVEYLKEICFVFIKVFLTRATFGGRVNITPSLSYFLDSSKTTQISTRKF